MAEGYYELGLFEEAFKLVESLPPVLRSSARLTLQRLQNTPSATDCQVALEFA